MNRNQLLSYLLILLAPLSVWSQSTENFPPPANPPQIVAEKVKDKITIDGILDEIAWQQTQATSNFFRVEPRQGGKYQYQTAVKVLYDERNLYFGVFARNSLGKRGIRVQDFRRDFAWGENDIFGVQLDPQNLKQYCVSFQTTPYGNQRDLQNFNDQNIDNDWNALWRVRTNRVDSGYFAEFAIPFKSLRYNFSNESDTTS